jgi:hypothetical protein
VENNKMKKFAGLITLLFSLTGCAASGPNFRATRYATQQAPVDKARIVFFRKSDTNYRSVTLAIDDDIVGKLDRRGFLVEETEPGRREISASGRLTIGDYRIRMNLQAGETYYIRVSPREERVLYAALGMFSAAGAVLQLTDNKGFFKLQLTDPKVALVVLGDLQLSE